MAVSIKWKYLWIFMAVSIFMIYIALIVVTLLKTKNDKTVKESRSLSRKKLNNTNHCPIISPHLYYMDMSNCTSLSEISREECPSRLLCLPYCPGLTYIPNLTSIESERNRWADKRSLVFCLRNQKDVIGTQAPASFDEYLDKINQGLCPKYMFRCSSFFNKICLPNELDEPLLTHLQPSNYTSSSGNGTRSRVPLYILVRSQEMFILWVCIACSIAVSFIVIYFLMFTFCVRGTVYTSLMTFLFFLTGSFCYCVTMTVMSLRCHHYCHLTFNIVWYYWLLSAATLAFFLYLYFDFMRKCYYSIPKAVQFLMYASRAIGRLASTMVFIGIGVAFQIMLIIIFLYFLFLIYSSTNRLNKVMDLSPDCICVNGYKNDTPCEQDEFEKWCKDRFSGKKCLDGGCYFYSVSLSEFEIFLISSLVLTTYYMMWFIKGAIDMILGTTIVQWYRDNFSSKIPFGQLVRKAFYCMRHQVGTLAVGSIIMVFLGIFHTLLQFIEHLTLYTADIKRVHHKRFAILCLDWLSKVTSSLIYVIAGVYNISYCEAARRVDLTMASRIKNVRLINKLVDMVLFICSLVVVVLTLSALLLVYMYPHKFITNISNKDGIYSIMSEPLFILALIVIGTYFLIANILSMYSISVNAIFITYIADVPEEVSRRRKYSSSRTIADEVNPDKFDTLSKLNDLEQSFII